MYRKTTVPRSSQISIGMYSTAAECYIKSNKKGREEEALFSNYVCINLEVECIGYDLMLPFFYFDNILFTTSAAEWMYVNCSEKLLSSTNVRVRLRMSMRTDE
jgi:hypothetical protein